MLLPRRLTGASVSAYFEDDEERCNAELAEFELTRKAPRVCNDFTLAQPVSDRHNRYRQVRDTRPALNACMHPLAHAVCLMPGVLAAVQSILAMEKRFVSNNFSFRFFTSMLGFAVVNAFFAHRYFNDKQASGVA